MKVAAIFPVGTSVGGCPAALAEILRNESSVEVHLLYGGRGDANTPDPVDSVAQIRTSIPDHRIIWATQREVEPFDLALAYHDVREFVSEVAGCDYERVYVGTTGATNPIVTSLFQAAMAYLRCEVIPVYVAANGGQMAQHFRASSIRDRIVAEEVLGVARSGQVRVAASLADRLKSADDWQFLAAALQALSLWDDFDYNQARQGLEQQARKASPWRDHFLLAPIASTVCGISIHAANIANLVKRIRDTQNFERTAFDASFEELLRSGGPMIVADAYANAERRMQEGRYTDAVLRAYRAAECATQMRLLALGIHPSKPDACSSAFSRYPRLALSVGDRGPRPFAFWDGIQFLADEQIIDATSIREPLRNLGNTRNSTYLEHGYVRVTRENATDCLDWSQLISEHLLGDLSDLILNLQMRF